MSKYKFGWTKSLLFGALFVFGLKILVNGVWYIAELSNSPEFLSVMIILSLVAIGIISLRIYHRKGGVSEEEKEYSDGLDDGLRGYEPRKNTEPYLDGFSDGCRRRLETEDN